jgi:molybdate transport system regulatory protein
MTSIDVRLRIHFGSKLAIGPGRIELLERVRRTGSLAQAARGMQMSYRRAWLLMRSLNDSLRKPASVPARGGRSGGGATVTPTGLALILSYRRMEARSVREARRRFARFARRPIAARASRTRGRSLAG